MNILPYLPFVEKMAILAAILWQRENIKAFIYSMLGEPGTNGISSKRVVMITCMVSFVHLCWYVTKTPTANLDTSILWAHVVIILTSATIATLPQLGAFFASIKGLIPAGDAPAPEPQPEKNAVEITTQTEVKENP